jgi:hypothetical protein
MPGGLLQLVVKGQLDDYISNNPNISFFKYAYKKHTNFSMESIQLLFESNPSLNFNAASGFTYNCKINRYGDLLGQIYLNYTLPAIYSSISYRFKWINNVGSLIIKNVNITVNGNIIDKTTGEWLTIWNELILPVKDSYNKLTGNTYKLTNPSLDKAIVGVINNVFSTIIYPISAKGDENPSIPTTNIAIPLNFWFCKNPSLALPLLQLQYSDIYLNFQFENPENLYQIYSAQLDKYISPSFYNLLNNTNINIDTFTLTREIFPYIEANYYYLDTEERNKFFAQPINTILVEQLEISGEQKIQSSAESSITINLKNHKITKEIIWTLKRDDYYKYNENTNYTASFPENSDNEILNKAVIIWNRTNNRTEEKPAIFFNKIQPYQHHSQIPKTGIYSYSFAIEPEKWFPTGSYNGAIVDTSITIYTNIYNNNTFNNLPYIINKNMQYNFDYTANVYIRSYNIFSISSGMGAMKFVL